MPTTAKPQTLDQIVAFCKRRGFVYNTSEIYGGLSNAYDYGPYGALMFKNIKDAFWAEFVLKRQDMYGIDSQIILQPQTWVASGHVGSFSDPLVEDKKTNKRYRADHLVEAYIKNAQVKGNAEFDALVVEDLKLDALNEFITKHGVLSPDGNPVTAAKPFNLLFETQIGTVADAKSNVYLRGETAQGIFSNFKQITDSVRVKLPFGVAQIGKSFRNEITQGQFVFRTFEFEQGEIEYFFDPSATPWQSIMDSFKAEMQNFLQNTMGLSQENLRWRRHTDSERSHYSLDTYDLDFNFPMGFKELWGIAYRTDYDLNAHITHSKQNLNWVDSKTGRKFVPHVIEPALGLNRLFLAVIAQGLCEEDLGEGKTRTVLKIKPSLAPIKAAIFPLQKDEKLREVAEGICNKLRQTIKIEFDDAGNIGKMYRRQDEIGTPFCITVDYKSLESGEVTVRERDTMKQESVKIENLQTYLDSKLKI